MSKPIIAVDCDDTLVPHFQDLITWYNAEYGTAVELADYRAGIDTLYRWGSLDLQVVTQQIFRFYETPAFRNAEPFEAAGRVLRLLGERFDLITVTARDTVIEAATYEFLARHFDGLFGQVHFAAFYSVDGDTKTKGEICQAVGASYLIDDAAEHCIEAMTAGISAILFGENPWTTRVALPKGVVKCKDWPAVLEYFDGIA